MAYLDIPDLWMVVRLAMALASISWAHVVNFLLAGNLIGDLAAVPSHGTEEDVTLGHQGWMIRLLEGIQWHGLLSGPPHPCTGAGGRGLRQQVGGLINMIHSAFSLRSRLRLLASYPS